MSREDDSNIIIRSERCDIENSKKVTHWRQFEKYVENVELFDKEGVIFRPKCLINGDYIYPDDLYEETVADQKFKIELKKDDIDKILRDQKACGKKKSELYVNEDILISHSIREYLKEKDVKVIKTCVNKSLNLKSKYKKNKKKSI